MTIPIMPPNNFSSRAPGPLYARIRDELRADIVTGIYQPHQRLPSESDLISRYCVSRITVRQALGELEKEGLLFKVVGKGMFVSKPKPFQSLGRLQGFAEAMSQQGHEIYNRLISLKFLPASAKVAQQLCLKEGGLVTELRRVRHLNREPISFDITYLSVSIGERLAKEDLATRDIFLIQENDYGIPLGYADLTIDAVLADAELAELLQVEKDSPILRIERLTHNSDGIPLDFEYLYCRADNFQFRLRVAR
jgi:GntR family transcriptional regulator